MSTKNKVSKVRNENRNGSFTKKGPGRFHKQGKQKSVPAQGKVPASRAGS